MNIEQSSEVKNDCGVCNLLKYANIASVNNSTKINIK